MRFVFERQIAAAAIWRPHRVNSLTSWPLSLPVASPIQVFALRLLCARAICAAAGQLLIMMMTNLPPPGKLIRHLSLDPVAMLFG
jgi:hypothetical protein